MEERRIEEIKEFVKNNFQHRTKEVQEFYDSLTEREKRLYDRTHILSGGGELWFKNKKDDLPGFEIKFKKGK